MPRTAHPKIVYLFGAGATHAEILTLVDPPTDTFLSKNGLLISDVSKRVIKIAQNNSRFTEHVKQVTYREGPVNIELLISLFEANRIPNVDFKVNHLKELIRKDIVSILTDEKKKKFYLHNALFELHTLTEEKEKLLGIISLNYDDILDTSYKKMLKTKPNYCHTSDGNKDVPLLKLHGSFNWTEIKISGRVKTIPIIPLGINKNYLTHPYNFIWGTAFELLVQCDILRIIGCSLSQNDIGLIDLLFKAHLERGKRIEIQIIDLESTGEQIKKNYGFFPGIVKATEIEGHLIPDESVNKDLNNVNPFRVWLKAKAWRMLDIGISETKYLKKCL